MGTYTKGQSISQEELANLLNNDIDVLKYGVSQDKGIEEYLSRYKGTQADRGGLQRVTTKTSIKNPDGTVTVLSISPSFKPNTYGDKASRSAPSGGWKVDTVTTYPTEQAYIQKAVKDAAPSGFSKLVNAGLAATAAYMTGGAAAGLGNIGAGALAGAAGGGVNSGLSGGNILEGAAKGGIIGAAAGGLKDVFTTPTLGTQPYEGGLDAVNGLDVADDTYQASKTLADVGTQAATTGGSTMAGTTGSGSFMTGDSGFGAANNGLGLDSITGAGGNYVDPMSSGSMFGGEMASKLSAITPESLASFQDITGATDLIGLTTSLGLPAEIASQSWFKSALDAVNKGLSSDLGKAAAQMIGNNMVDKSIGRDIDKMFTRIEGSNKFNTKENIGAANAAFTDTFGTNTLKDLFGNSADYTNKYDQQIKSGFDTSNDFLSKAGGFQNQASTLLGDQTGMDQAKELLGKMDQFTDPYASQAKAGFDMASRLASNPTSHAGYNLATTAAQGLEGLYTDPMSNPLMQAVSRLTGENAARKSAAGRGLNAGSMPAEMQDALMVSLAQNYSNIANPMNQSVTAGSNWYQGDMDAGTKLGSAATTANAQEAAIMDQLMKAVLASYTANTDRAGQALAGSNAAVAGSNSALSGANAGINGNQVGGANLANLMSAANNMTTAQTGRGTAISNAANAHLNAMGNLAQGALQAAFATNPTMANITAAGQAGGSQLTLDKLGNTIVNKVGGSLINKGVNALLSAF